MTSSTPVPTFELTGETKTTRDGVVLHRIRALVDIPTQDVKAGDLGGWVESATLPDGTPRITDTAWVADDAQVYGDARVFDAAQVSGHACVSGDACVFGDVEITSGTLGIR